MSNPAHVLESSSGVSVSVLKGEHGQGKPSVTHGFFNTMSRDCDVTRIVSPGS